MAVLDATFADLTAEGADVDAAKSSCAERITRTREFFGKVVEQDGVKDRSGHLALLELEKRSKQHGLATGEYDDVAIYSTNDSAQIPPLSLLCWRATSSTSVAKRAALRI